MNFLDNIPTIQVAGIGDAGIKMVNRMIAGRMPGVRFLTVNTHPQESDASCQVRVGKDLARGNPDAVRQAIRGKGTTDKIREALIGTDLVFIVAGMGGGAGTGAAPVVAEYAGRAGALTVGLVTRPFDMEGESRAQTAEEGIEALEKRADSVIVVSNQGLLDAANSLVSPIQEAYEMAGWLSYLTVNFFTDLLRRAEPKVSMDVIRRVLASDGQEGAIGMGIAAGENRAVEAARKAIRPYVGDVSIGSTKEALVRISGKDVSEQEAEEAVAAVRKVTGARITWGVVRDAGMDEHLSVTVFAAGGAG